MSTDLGIARAGTFHVYSCSDPVTQVPLPTNGWIANATIDGSRVANDCSSNAENGGLQVNIAGAPPIWYSWSFAAGENREIVAATLYRSVVANSSAVAFWRTFQQYGDPLDIATEFDQCHGTSTGPCYHGTQPCQGPSCVSLRPYPASDVLQVPASQLPAEWLGTTLACQQGCGGSIALHSADITLQQDIGPNAASTGGSLVTQDVLRGPADIRITATDPGSGVFDAVFQVDGHPVYRQIIDANGGSCAPYRQEPDGSYVFLSPAPCPQSVSNADVVLDTALVPDGVHQLSVLVRDAAGNAATVLSRTVAFDERGQYTLQLQRNEEQQALVARGACNASCDDDARLKGSDESLVSRPFARRYQASGLTLTGKLLDHAGSPIPGARIEMGEQPGDTAASSLLRATTTDSKGRWELRVPRGPSRELTVGFRSHANDRGYATDLQYHEDVSAGVALNAPSRVRPGRAFYFRGHLAGGYLPPSGVLVSLEIHFAGRWREIALLRADKHGKFTYRYTFAPIASTVYRFRASVPHTVAYPFLTGVAPPVKIRVL
jgi:hypothetical protein